MWKWIKSSALPCLASSVAVTLTSWYRTPQMWDGWGTFKNVVFYFVVTVVIVAAILWLWDTVRGKK